MADGYQNLYINSRYIINQYRLIFEKFPKQWLSPE